jgi:LPXTG-motif cell wall-anchored protein
VWYNILIMKESIQKLTMAGAIGAANMLYLANTAGAEEGPTTTEVPATEAPTTTEEESSTTTTEDVPITLAPGDGLVTNNPPVEETPQELPATGSETAKTLAAVGGAVIIAGLGATAAKKRMQNQGQVPL